MNYCEELRAPNGSPLYGTRASRAHDVWNGAAARKTADMRDVDNPHLPAFTYWIDGRTEAGGIIMMAISEVQIPESWGRFC